MDEKLSQKILLVDDEPGIREVLSEILRLEGHEVLTAANGEEAVQLLREKEFDLLMSDLRMPGMDGLALLAWVQNQGPTVPCLMISGHGDVAEAVEAMKLGASDYLVKPFEPDELLLRLERVTRNHRLEKALSLSSGNGQPSTDSNLTSKSPLMRQVLSMAEKAAPSNASILISGESGTGKEVLARWIHSKSERRDAPFVPINLGGIPDSLLESELFGYEKGAFTGADKRKSGLFELANTGTLFLDEIGDMPLGLQVKLLRVLQERRIQRLGSIVSLPIDVRIISASHRDLEAAVKAGSFREDLLYRLKVIPLHLPPLRDRKEDLEDLVEKLLKKHKRNNNVKSLGSEALKELKAYAFPGNIRELENMIERALILCETNVLQARDLGLSEYRLYPDLPPSKQENELKENPQIAIETTPPPGMSLEALEKWAILQALEKYKGRRLRAAEELGISRRTLLNKLNEYGIDKE